MHLRYSSTTTSCRSYTTCRRHHIHPLKHTHCQKTTYSHTYKTYTWTTLNNLILNADKTTCTLFTSRPTEYSAQLGLKIQNTTLPMNIHPKILGVTLDPKLTYNTHRQHSHQSMQITTDKLSPHLDHVGKQKEMLLATYKTMTWPIWSCIASSTNIEKLQIIQNTTLHIATDAHKTQTYTFTAKHTFFRWRNSYTFQ